MMLMNEPVDILVFKTNIQLKEDIEKIVLTLNEDIRIKRWTVDREDCDKVLRVEASQMNPADVIELIKKAGYACEELSN